MKDRLRRHLLAMHERDPDNPFTDPEVVERLERLAWGHWAAVKSMSLVGRIELAFWKAFWWGGTRVIPILKERPF